MEPVHGGRDDPVPFAPRFAPDLPQWSPSTEDGTTPGPDVDRIP